MTVPIVHASVCLYDHWDQWDNFISRDSQRPLALGLFFHLANTAAHVSESVRLPRRLLWKCWCMLETDRASTHQRCSLIVGCLICWAYIHVVPMYRFAMSEIAVHNYPFLPVWLFITRTALWVWYTGTLPLFLWTRSGETWCITQQGKHPTWSGCYPLLPPAHYLRIHVHTIQILSTCRYCDTLPMFCPKYCHSTASHHALPCHRLRLSGWGGWGLLIAPEY